MFMLADFFLTIASQVGPRLLAGRAVGLLLLGHGDSGFWPGPAKATLQPRRESARALAGNGMEPYRQVIIRVIFSLACGAAFRDAPCAGPRFHPLYPTTPQAEAGAVRVNPIPS